MTDAQHQCQERQLVFSRAIERVFCVLARNPFGIVQRFVCAGRLCVSELNMYQSSHTRTHWGHCTQHLGKTYTMINKEIIASKRWTVGLASQMKASSSKFARCLVQAADNLHWLTGAEYRQAHKSVMYSRHQLQVIRIGETPTRALPPACHACEAPVRFRLHQAKHKKVHHEAQMLRTVKRMPMCSPAKPC